MTDWQILADEDCLILMIREKNWSYRRRNTKNLAIMYEKIIVLLLTPWCRVLLEKLADLHLVK